MDAARHNGKQQRQLLRKQRLADGDPFSLLTAHANGRPLYVNADGSVDVWFGPKAPKGRENNWVQTVPGRGWSVLLRLYGPEKSWFDQTWTPGEFELVK